MSITELTAKIEQDMNSLNKAERIEILEKSGIIDKNGYLSSHYYSDSVVKNDHDENEPLKK